MVTPRQRLASVDGIVVLNAFDRRGTFVIQRMVFPPIE
jgi:hypothetical protein